MNYRPSYSNVYLGEINGIETASVSSLFAGYKWKVNGYRLSTELDFFYRTKRNSLRSWSYKWDVLASAESYGHLEMAFHSIKYTILIPVLSKSN